MIISVKNPKTLRKSNKINILSLLLNRGDMSRLQLAESLGLTGASLTQLTQELMQEGLIIEGDSVQRNNTGRREVMLTFNYKKCAAVGVNIERDIIHIAVCNYKEVIVEKQFRTRELITAEGDISKLSEAVNSFIDNYEDRQDIIGVGVGIAGNVDEINGVSIYSGGIFPESFPFLYELKKTIKIAISVTNNVKAQARALINDKDDNFMFVKHSPGVGCALVMNGKIVEGYNDNAGELGHTMVDIYGGDCVRGKKVRLETAVSESSIEKETEKLTGKYKSIEEIYLLYGKDRDVDLILQKRVDYLALAIGNAAMLTDPQRIILTGGIFSVPALQSLFVTRIKEIGYGNICEASFIGNDKKVKAFAGAIFVIRKLLFEA